jgi:serine/threonine protein phosphatase PrpC
MEVSYYELSLPGLVRAKNEDSLGFRAPEEEEEWRRRGAVCILCDGVGGQGDGDKASQLAVKTALEAYADAAPGTPPSALLRQMFNTANLAVYDAAMQNRHAKTRMATTMSVSLLRHHEAHIGHVGDCRVYHIHGREITRVTTDHSYTGMQMKLGLISAQEAANSDLRCVLTRSMGKDPMVQVDFYTIQINPGDFILQCCDGVYTSMSEQEILEIVNRRPEQACNELIALCERRGSDDNLSVQLIQIRNVERVTYYRGLPLYEKVSDPTMGQDLQIDQILDGRYQIIDQISKSGMASIYRAIDTKTGNAVALKVPYMQFESDPGFYTRFQREEQIGQKLRHPHIIRIESPEDLEKSRPYIVMEFLQGQTLGQVMKSVKPMPESDALKIASRICDALQYLHENEVIHRDLKPDNIMICDDGSIRIMDFGIAKVEGARRLTFGKFQPAMGTPDYMSPEQVRGARGDARTDIYSMGAILYEMTTGYPPFEGANPLVIMNSRLTGDPVAPRVRNPNLSAAAEEIILHAMARKPDNRYQSAAEMRKDLDYPGEVQITGRAERLEPVKPMQVGLRRYWVVFLVIGLTLLFCIILLLTRLKIHVEMR